MFYYVYELNCLVYLHIHKARSMTIDYTIPRTDHQMFYQIRENTTWFNQWFTILTFRSNFELKVSNFQMHWAFILSILSMLWRIAFSFFSNSESLYIFGTSLREKNRHGFKVNFDWRLFENLLSIIFLRPSFLAF